MPTCDSDAAAQDDVLVEPARALALGAVEGASDAALEVAGELVEEEPPQRSGVARVAGEERALDRLRQVDEREDRPVEVREMRLERLALFCGERLDGIAHRGRASVAPAPAASPNPQVSTTYLVEGSNPRVSTRYLVEGWSVQLDELLERPAVEEGHRRGLLGSQRGLLEHVARRAPLGRVVALEALRQRVERERRGLADLLRRQRPQRVGLPDRDVEVVLVVRLLGADDLARLAERGDRQLLHLVAQLQPGRGAGVDLPVRIGAVVVAVPAEHG